MSDISARTYLDDVTHEFLTRFNAGSPQRPRGDLAFVTVPLAELVAAVSQAKQRHGFTHLVFLTAVDLLERGLFRLSYMLHNPQHVCDLCIQAEVSRDAPTVESIHHLWAQAATYQRELKEMFGIDFPLSPGVDEPFILEGWDDLPPMRRDFDTREYSEKTYFPRPGREKHSTAETLKRELYPEVDL